MVDPVVGFRFRPTDEEIVGHYVRPKNLGSNTSHVDEVMNTVDIYSFDPWELPGKSRINSTDEVWYFFGCKKNQQHMLNKQSRKTNSGFWKKTGDTTDIMRKRGGDGEKIGEKRVFVFSTKIPSGSKSKSKSDWVMHEYIATFLSPDSPPNQTMTYTVCKVMFKGDPTDLPSSSYSAGENEHDCSLIPHVVDSNSGVLNTEAEVEPTPDYNYHLFGPSCGQYFGRIEYRDRGSEPKPGYKYSLWRTEYRDRCGVVSFELQNPHQFSAFLHLEEDARTEDETLRALNSLLNYVHAEEEHVNLLFRQEDRNDYRPKKSLTGFISDDDSDSDSITTTCSTKSSSTCVSFRSSNPPIRLPESPCSTIESRSLTQEVSKALGPNTVISEKKMSPCDDEAQGSDTRGDQMGQDMVIKNKKAGFIYRMIQRFTKKIKLCSCISRT
ncbi:hypothetical protein Bca4012_056634 [Brassica carinata]